MAKDKPINKTKKVFVKAKDTAKKAIVKTKDKAKTTVNATKGKLKELRGNSIFNEILAKGEFVVNNEYRLMLAIIAYLLLVALFLMTLGELLFAFVTHFFLKKYSHLVPEFGITQYMILSFLALLVFDIFFLWALTRYQEVEERHDVPGIKRRHICIKMSFYLSFALLLIMIVLYWKTSGQFGGLPRQMGKRMEQLMGGYNNSREDKETIDRMQWSYKCCGKSGHKNWVDYCFNGNQNIVPFSCCKNSATICHFNDLQQDQSFQTINTKGCVDEILDGFVALRKAVQWYRLTEFLIVFCYALLIDIIERSLHSEYDLKTAVPVSRFPLFYVFASIITFLILYFCFFVSFK